jgi:hypothetical protein
MIPRALFPVNSAYTRYMREDKVPLCDRHHFRMRTEQCSFLPKIVFSVHRKAVGVITGDNTGISTCFQPCRHHWNRLPRPTAA